MSPSKKASAAGGADRLSALPDALIHHVMSFLQARQAVRTCVLARRWRHLWRSMPVVRVTQAAPAPVPAQHLRKFLDHLLLLRDRSNLDSFLLEFTAFPEADDAAYVNLWIRHALLCQARVLRVGLRGSSYQNTKFPLDDLPLVSRNLTRLELFCLKLHVKFMDFSSCPALKVLKMIQCSIHADKIYSGSLKRLKCHECSFVSGTRACVSAPGLVWLRLTDFTGRTPLFEDMSVLVRAIIKFGPFCEDDCGNDDPGYCYDSDCEGCYGIDDGSAGCVLLKGLSAAADLDLIAEPEMFILKRDLRWCPTFRWLKTLLLSEWCVVGDHNALICILQHSPVLKNLTLQLPEEDYNMDSSKAIYNPVEQSFASKKLKRVNVKCHEVDQRVNNILKSLVTYGVPLKKIFIQQENESSECFTFICKGFCSK